MKKKEDAPEPEEPLQRAIALFQAGDLEGAERLFVELADAAPGSASAQNNLANVYRAQGRLELAIPAYRRALDASPDDPGIHYNLGNALADQRNFDQAIAMFQRALQLRPTYADAWNSLGVALMQVRRAQEALGAFHRAVEANPSNPDVLCNLGNAQTDRREYDEAVASYARAIELNPDHAHAHNGLGYTLQCRGDLDAAVRSYQRALTLLPDFAVAHNNLGNALRLQDHPQEAIASYQRSLEILPDYSDAWNNLGVVLVEAHRMDEGLAAHRRAIELAPEGAIAHQNYAHALLLLGRFEEGLREYEWRLEVAIDTLLWRRRQFAQPRWVKDRRAGTRVFVYAEQGVGDTLQFVRYIPMLAELGAEVILECQPSLQRLLGSLSGASTLLAQGAVIPDFDAHVPLLSLPHALGTTLDTIPAPIPYLGADPDLALKWKKRLPRGAFNVGLVWAGLPTHLEDRKRSIAPALFEPLMAIRGVRLVSLQKGEATQQATASTKGPGLLDFTEELTDFADTAALVAGLDLVISVDTAVAHLAGAMGKKVWLLSRFESEWRWMLDREDSPWYPTMRIFRQRTPGDWAGVVERVAAELAQLVTRR